MPMEPVIASRITSGATPGKRRHAVVTS